MRTGGQGPGQASPLPRAAQAGAEAGGRHRSQALGPPTVSRRAGVEAVTGEELGTQWQQVVSTDPAVPGIRFTACLAMVSCGAARPLW